MAAPLWAEKLVKTVASDYDMPAPDLHWRRARRPRYSWQVPSVHSSGLTSFMDEYVHVTAGSSRKDQLFVVLHEMAHWVSREGHTKKFWATAYELYERYGLDLTHAYRRETSYKKGARAVFDERMGR